MRFKTWFPTTQSLLIVAIIDVLVTPEPGIFAMDTSRPSVELIGQMPKYPRLNKAFGRFDRAC